jgi:exodeoxyribonuclease VII small subunit
MATKKANNESYQVLRAQLDDVLLKLQDPDCDVDEAVDLYEQALQLVDKLEKHLQTAENRVQKIKADFGLAGNEA